MRVACPCSTEGFGSNPFLLPSFVSKADLERSNPRILSDSAGRPACRFELPLGWQWAASVLRFLLCSFKALGVVISKALSYIQQADSSVPNRPASCEFRYRDSHSFHSSCTFLLYPDPAGLQLPLRRFLSKPCLGALSWNEPAARLMTIACSQPFGFPSGLQSRFLIFIGAADRATAASSH